MSKVDELREDLIREITSDYDGTSLLDEVTDAVTARVDEVIQAAREDAWKTIERLSEANGNRRLLISWDPRAGWNATFSRERNVIGSSRHRKTAREAILAAIEQLDMGM